MAVVPFDRDVEVLPQGEFPADYKGGHFAVIGSTGSGKSYYAKYIVKNLVGLWDKAELPPVYLFVDPISAAQWAETERDGSMLVPLDQQYHEWNEDIVTELMQHVAKPGPKLIIFDDFKGKVNFHGDKHFKNMFRTFRQCQAQVLAIGHSPNDIPPVVRDNVTHVVLAFTNNLETIKSLAQQYLMADHARLRKALQAMTEEFMMIKINAKRNSLALHKASDPSIHTTNFDDIALPAGCSAAISGGTSGASGRFGPDVRSSARGDVTVAGAGATYNDHSTNQNFLRLQQDMDIRNQEHHMTMMHNVQRAEMQMALEEKRFKHDRKMAHIREIHQCRDLLHNPVLSVADRDAVARTVSRALRRPGLTPHEIFLNGYDVEFMEMHFPEDDYGGRDKARSALAAYGGGVESFLSGDTAALVKEGANLALTSGLVGKVAGLIKGPSARSSSGPRSTSGSRRKARTQAGTRKEIRARILQKKYQTEDDKRELVRLMNRIHPQKNATVDNCGAKALKFMQKYYPDDYDQIVARFRRK